ncbi:ankyrin repeat domain-containing protein 50-like [Saccostrea cucullata]|uniref:ankyrin repeat domain-containing protein 50-like n=1 Tax=Saccostrea cuccullata TaxID=36930 RepID=UPI002ED313F6
MHSKSVNQWCDTCKKWREELRRLMRYPGLINRINWQLFDSRTWGRDSTEATINQIINVFIHNCQNVTECGLDDITNIISLLENCLYFDIGKNKQLMTKIRTIRNKNFAHNKSCHIEEKDLKKCLNVLLNCLQHNTVCGNLKCMDAAKKLSDLKNKEIGIRCEWVSYLLDVLHDRPNELHDTIMRHIDECLDLHVQPLYSKTQVEFKNIVLLFIISASSIYLIISLFFGMHLTGIENMFRTSTKSGCLTMDFSFPWKSDIDFEYYITIHKDFIGREWIIEDISYYLLNTEHRGLLLTAEMGFGKSAIISNIVCSNNKLSVGYPIYDKLAAVHLCKYDSQITLEQGLFVRNLAGGIAQKLPEFGNIIQFDKMAIEYLFTNKCTEDPKGCFDFAILSPLQKVQSAPEKLIIIVDALDECSESGYDSIFSLLHEKVPRFPAYIKLLFTSRNISRIRDNLPPGMIIYTNEHLKENNVEDVKRFIKNRLENTTVNRKFGEILSDYHIDTQIEKIADQVDGNFLFLIHGLDYWIKTKDLGEIPDTLEHIYQLNLERVFGKSREAFEKVRSIFEILCANLNHITKEELFLYLNVTHKKDKDSISRIFNDELSHFLTKNSELGTIGFSHKRLSDFLSGEVNINKNFFISKEPGHAAIAKYWIDYLGTPYFEPQRLDMLAFLYHVANSGDDDIKKLFNDRLHHRSDINISDFTKFILHKAAARFNSLETIKLIISSWPQLNVDEEDSGGSSPSYVSAAFGNEMSLKSLLDNGADISYVKPTFQIDRISPELDIINICKYETHWGYNLLNVASQNGHEGVVKVLLQNNVDVLHENAVGLNSFHLAAEHGHLRILNILLFNHSTELISSFNISLYLAAKNGHAHVVEYLLSTGAVDRCLTCNGRLYWVPKGKKRLQNKGSNEITDEAKFVLKDDQRFLFCESSLEIATQNGHLEVVKILLRQQFHAISCTDARGRTPIFTAVAFDRKDILLYFWKLGINFDKRCEKRTKVSVKGHEKMLFHSKQCINGLHFAHMLALYSSFKTVISLFKEKYRMPVVTDANGATPMHYASCSGIDTTTIAVLEKSEMYRLKRGMRLKEKKEWGIGQSIQHFCKNRTHVC